jgi:uncharacterized MAPEG superfamily protein
MDPTVKFALFWFTSMIVSDMLYMAKRPIVSTIVFLIPCVIGTVGIGVFVVEVLKIENGVQ